LPRTSPPSVAPVLHVGHPSGQHIAMNKEVHLQARVHVIVAGTGKFDNSVLGWRLGKSLLMLRIMADGTTVIAHKMFVKMPSMSILVAIHSRCHMNAIAFAQRKCNLLVAISVS